MPKTRSILIRWTQKSDKRTNFSHLEILSRASRVYRTGRFRKPRKSDPIKIAKIKKRLLRRNYAFLRSCYLAVAPWVSSELDIDAHRLFLTIAALGWFYFSNMHTLSNYLRKDLAREPALHEWLQHIIAVVLASLAPHSQNCESARSDADRRAKLLICQRWRGQSWRCVYRPASLEARTRITCLWTGHTCQQPDQFPRPPCIPRKGQPVPAVRPGR